LEQVKLTEEQIQRIEEYSRLNFANLKKSEIKDLIQGRNGSSLYKRYPIKRIIDMLERPEKNEKSLREMSNYLYITSSHYRRLISYYANLPTFNYMVVPVRLPEKKNKTEYKKAYYQTVFEFEKYNIKSELPKILTICLLEGVFYGLIYESSDTFYIKEFPSDYADIQYIEDGCYIPSINLTYFNNRQDQLPRYGSEIEKAYWEYKGDPKRGIKGDQKKKWFSPSNGICIKMDESNLLYSIPFFCGIFKEILDLEDYRLLTKAKKEIDNYKVLAMKMQTDDDGIPKMEYGTAIKYYDQAAANIPEGIGLILTPFEINDFSFKSPNASETDAVTDAQNNLYGSAGVSPLLFGSAKATSSAALSLSVKPDEKISFDLIHQVARNFNRIQKKKDLPYGFALKFLEQSIFNQDEFSNRVFKGAQYGVDGAKLLFSSSIGISPSDSVTLAYLENDILGLTKTSFNRPLKSSNTMSGSSDDDGGRPTNQSKGKQLTESGEQTSESGQNDNR